MTTNERVQAQALSTLTSPFADDGEAVSAYLRRTRRRKLGRVAKARARCRRAGTRGAARHTPRSRLTGPDGHRRR